jgi:hypothetical protein
MVVGSVGRRGGTADQVYAVKARDGLAPAPLFLSPRPRPRPRAPVQVWVRCGYGAPTPECSRSYVTLPVLLPQGKRAVALQQGKKGYQSRKGFSFSFAICSFL